jgi:hypothetical protein
MTSGKKAHRNAILIIGKITAIICCVTEFGLCRSGQHSQGEDHRKRDEMSFFEFRAFDSFAMSRLCSRIACEAIRELSSKDRLALGD